MVSCVIRSGSDQYSKPLNITGPNETVTESVKENHNEINSYVFDISSLSFHLFTRRRLLRKKKTGKDLQDAVKRVDGASEVLNEIMTISDKSIPRDLLAKGESRRRLSGRDQGRVHHRRPGRKGRRHSTVGRGWSAPAFLNMAGGSLGFQIGGSKTDYILLVMNDKGMKGLVEDKFELGGEGSVAAGPDWSYRGRFDKRNLRRRDTDVFAEQGTVRRCLV